MMSAVLSNPNHPEYGVATIPFPIPHDQYTYCICDYDPGTGSRGPARFTKVSS